MIKWVIKKCLSNRKLYSYALNARNELQSQTSLTSIPDINIPEITPMEFSASSIDERRINIMLPAISEMHIFGGIATALRFFEQLIKGFPSARIIVCDEVEAQLSDTKFYSNWRVLEVGESDVEGNSIVFSGNRYNRTLPVRKNDYFIATAWWTAYNGLKLLDWQGSYYQLTKRVMVYLIQDYEPGFYAWSSRYALADSTYKQKEKILPVFNTELLSDFFSFNNYEFERFFYFQPIFNPTINNYKQKLLSTTKKKKILVYGRPGVERNLFPIVVQSLRKWVSEYESSSDWEVISAGEAHSDIELSNSVMLRSVGKVSLEEYAQLLAESSIGLSLMLSPHPSYPPLEMAMFGIDVLTNRYANKDLSKINSSLNSIDSIDPKSIADKLTELCERKKHMFQEIYTLEKSLEGVCLDKIFSRNTEEEFGFIDEINSFLM